MRKALALITMMVVSGSVLAATQTKQSETTLQTEVFNSEQKAQQAGFKIIHDLRELSSEELTFKLGVVEPLVVPDSVKINNSELKVESIMVEPDKTSYRGLVNVDYQYDIKDHNN